MLAASSKPGQVPSDELSDWKLIVGCAGPSSRLGAAEIEVTPVGGWPPPGTAMIENFTKSCIGLVCRTCVPRGPPASQVEATNGVHVVIAVFAGMVGVWFAARQISRGISVMVSGCPP